MRSKSFISVLGVAGFVFATALVVNNFSFAQELSGQVAESKVSTEDQMAQLIESQNNLTNALEKLLVKQEPEVDSGAQAAALVAGNAPRPICTNDLGSGPTSTTYKQSEWDSIFVVESGGHFVDVNGDGLVDYVYTNNIGGVSGCVYLNTGDGWERVFKCKGSSSSGTWTYRGDCAA